MLDVFNFPTPQNSNYQEFYNTGEGASDGLGSATWIKPRGASMVRMMLIGAGGGGGNGSTTVGGGGGGSGAITSWIGPAIFIPDSLIITVGQGGSSGVTGGTSRVSVKINNNYFYLLQAPGGNSGSTTVTAGTGAAVMSNNFFGAAGIFTSVEGQAGANGGSTGSGSSRGASSVTFLQGGSGGSGNSTNTGGAVTPQYGYPVLAAAPAGIASKGADGYFMTQPIIIGCGGAGGSTNGTAGTAGGKGGIGCGGGGAGEDATTSGFAGGRGGDGAVFIWAW